MAISIRQGNTAHSLVSVASLDVTLPLTVQTGSAVYVWATCNNGTFTDIVISCPAHPGDSYSDTFGLLNDTTAFGATTLTRGGIFITPTVGSQTYRVTPTGGNTTVTEIVAYEVTGFTGTPTVDKSNNAPGTAVTADSGPTGTLTQAIEVAFAFIIVTSSMSAAGVGWSIGGTNITDGIDGSTGDLAEHQVTAATTSINGTGSSNGGAWRACVVTIMDVQSSPAVILEMNSTSAYITRKVTAIAY